MGMKAKLSSELSSTKKTLSIRFVSFVLYSMVPTGVNTIYAVSIVQKIEYDNQR